jgi:ABC-2 type transport system ATP-binding protein
MIRIDAVTKKFRDVRVLDALSLEIPAGQRVALVGSNGAGKTTLIRCLLGEYQFDGRLTVDGLDPRRDRAAMLARVGFVPQLPPPLKMPTAELVRFAAAVAGADPAKVAAVAAALGLDLAPIRHRPFVKLSGGQKQKLLIALALARPCRLLIMDEPAANLDPPARKTLFSLLDERRDAAMLITSHRLDEVAALVNRVVELDAGKVTLDDSVADSVALSRVLDCRLGVARAEPAFAHAMAEWGLNGDAAGTFWRGEVAGPDRLRFLGALSRYAGLLTDISLQERRT